MAEDYKVGYRRPPRHARFKKGETGNPTGRPKGSRNLSTVLRKVLMAPTAIVDGRGGKRIKVPMVEALMRKLMADYAQGNMAAAKILGAFILRFADRLPPPDNDNRAGAPEEDRDDDAIIRAALAQPKDGGDA